MPKKPGFFRRIKTKIRGFVFGRGRGWPKELRTKKSSWPRKWPPESK